MKQLLVGDLIKLLEGFDKELPVFVTDWNERRCPACTLRAEDVEEAIHRNNEKAVFLGA